MRMRNVTGGLLTGLERDLKPAIGTASLKQDPEEIARRERTRLGVTIEDQQNWKHQWEAFARWHYKNDPTHVCFFSRDTWLWWARQYGAQLQFKDADVIVLAKL